MTDQTTQETTTTAMPTAVSCNIAGCAGNCGICQPTPTVEGSGRTALRSECCGVALLYCERDDDNVCQVCKTHYRRGERVPAPSPTAARGVTGVPTMDRLAKIEAMLDATTQGTWRWFGNLRTRSFYLATEERGRQFVMQFDRWGMQGAQPAVRSRSDEGAIMVRIENLVDREKIRTDHNDEIIDVKHPDLAFIAAAPSLVRELIEQVRTLLSAAEQGGKDRRELESLGRAYGKLASQLRSAAEQGERDRRELAWRRWVATTEEARRVVDDVIDGYDFAGWEKHELDAFAAELAAAISTESNPDTAQYGRQFAFAGSEVGQPRQEGDR